jgi:hypothetical protein
MQNETAIMTQDYCCDNLRELGNNGYIDGELIYLQKLDVSTNLPKHLRHYRYCISCGKANYGHPVDNVPYCLTLRNGQLRNNFGQMTIYDVNADQNEFAFNLNTRNEYVQFRNGDPNFPDQAGLNFCPYCRRRYFPVITR